MMIIDRDGNAIVTLNCVRCLMMIMLLTFISRPLVSMGRNKVATPQRAHITPYTYNVATGEPSNNTCK